MYTHERRQLAPERFGTIVFARVLSLPLAHYERFVTKVEASAGFNALRPYIQEALIEGAQVDPAGAISDPDVELGALSISGESIHFCYRRTSFAREYRFCEATLCKSGIVDPQDKFLHQLRLINSRNRLTHAIVNSLLKVQTSYLRTQNPLLLEPLSQAALSRLLTAQGTLSMTPDAGRISRLVRGLAIRSWDGKVLQLPTLLPNERKTHRLRLEALIRTEKQLILGEQLAKPWPDDMLARLLSENRSRPVTARSVGYIRHQLGIPSYWQRSHCLEYLTAAEGFSPLFPLTHSNLLTRVPDTAGVYEIRAKIGVEPHVFGSTPFPKGISNVIYIGSSGNMKKRILNHVRGHSENPQLFSFLNAGGALARFRTVASEWRLFEKQLYQAFCMSFGHPPVCNRMSP